VARSSAVGAGVEARRQGHNTDTTGLACTA
jgi:hypothetical protein